MAYYARFTCFVAALLVVWFWFGFIKFGVAVIACLFVLFGFVLCFGRCFSVGVLYLVACGTCWLVCLCLIVVWRFAWLALFLAGGSGVLFTLYRLLGCFNCLLRVALRFMFLMIGVGCFGDL